MTNKMRATIAVAALAIAGIVTPVRADWNPGRAIERRPIGLIIALVSTKERPLVGAW